MLQAADATCQLTAADDVVIARVELPAGTEIIKEKIRASVTVPAGHKIAARDIAEGSAVRRYNQIIGFAVKPIKAGDHVHVHNLAMGDFQRDYAFCADFKPVDYVANPATFQGIVRECGRVANPVYRPALPPQPHTAHDPPRLAP